MQNVKKIKEPQNNSQYKYNVQRKFGKPLSTNKHQEIHALTTKINYRYVM